ncbi:hypothetical protein EGW08_006075 [Elysia chlorotica]|uniref:Uncharacterized protein n=1 Tax=Elysia chlorotica TaxID=188477 RepID=A0A3S1BE03_ELYCH|nr:hypothetical protein EGW08_006075 [Elysia chlorotica]
MLRILFQRQKEDRGNTMVIGMTHFQLLCIALLHIFQSANGQNLPMTIDAHSDAMFLQELNSKNTLNTFLYDLSRYAPVEGLSKIKLRRKRRSQGRLGKIHIQEFNKNSPSKTSREPDFYGAVFSPALKGSMSSMSNLKPKNHGISQGIGFIESAISKFDDTNLKSQAISDKFEKIAFPREDKQPKKEKADRQIQPDPFSDGKVNFVKPAAITAGHAQNDDMKNLFLDSFLPPVKDEDTSTLGSRTDQNKHKTQSTAVSSVKEPDMEVPILSKDVSVDDKSFLENQHVIYKDSHVIHPVESPSQYPSYPVNEEPQVTSDMKVIGTLLRNVHATEKRVKSLLHG